MCISPTDEIVTTIEDLTTCTQYSLEIGAGPVTCEPGEDETFQENWRFGEDSFKTFVSTTPVSNKNDHRNISDDIFTPKIACRTRKKVICLLQYSKYFKSSERKTIY